MFDPYTMVGIFGIGAYPFCFNIRMVSYAMFWAVLVLVPVGVNMVLKPFGTDKKTIIGLAIGILAFVYGGIQIRPDTEEPEDADEDNFF